MPFECCIAIFQEELPIVELVVLCNHMGSDDAMLRYYDANKRVNYVIADRGVLGKGMCLHSVQAGAVSRGI